MIRLAFRNSIAQRNQNLRHGNGIRMLSGGPVSGAQQAGFGKVLVLLTPIAAGAGVVSYAKYDEKFRKTLTETVPGIEPVLKVLLFEEGNAIDEASKTISNATHKVTDSVHKVTDSVSSVTSYFTGTKLDEKPAAAAVKKPERPVNVPIASPTKSAKSSEAMAVPAPPMPTISKVASAEQVPKKQVTVDMATATVAATPLPANIEELQQAVEVAAKTAAKEYSKAIEVLESYNSEIRKIVDESVDNNSAWSTLKNKTSARDSAVLAAESAAQVARATIDKLERSIQLIAKDSSVELIEKVGDHIRSTSDHLNRVKDQMYDAKDTAKLSEKFWRNVETSRNYFIDEVEALFPGLNLSENKLNLSKDDLDLFIVYAHSHVLAYQKELQKLHIEGETRLRRAVEALRGDDVNDVVNRQLEYYLEKEKQTMAIENQKKLFQMRSAAEKELRKNMKVQAEAHSDHLKDALTQKEVELKRTFNRELHEKLSTEQAAYKEQLAAMQGKLRGIDAALKARADTDRMVQQAQSLWSACQALWASVRTGDPAVSWQHKLRPLASEVSAISRSAEGDELVAAVLASVPDEAKTRGVYPEDALRERFIKVERLARRVALVPADGARLPMYLLSYIQSVFILTPDNPIPKEELANEPIDVSKFDTYDILNRAKYWMERGDLVQTLKYMNLLQGAPRKIANDWLKEARLLLETQQATNILMAHAATSGLTFL